LNHDSHNKPFGCGAKEIKTEIFRMKKLKMLRKIWAKVSCGKPFFQKLNILLKLETRLINPSIKPKDKDNWAFPF